MWVHFLRGRRVCGKYVRKTNIGFVVMGVEIAI